jgi:hypothetical protein
MSSWTEEKDEIKIIHSFYRYELKINVRKILLLELITIKACMAVLA